MSNNQLKQNYYFNILYILCYISIILIISIYLTKNININIKNCEIENPIDYQIRDSLDKCYLTIHNFIKINSSIFQLNTNDSNEKLNFTQNNQQSFNTYITSYSKPYLIELIHNSTEDCLCCH